ncbi:MarR family winged helix-turn-helix transcriptional regulator [Noviherbaspirillum saxi]|uniref:MarR family transcriptional regulator n=1 Tax=Noviherbaspirillum saxi TaxID=2320863 RepID=A0A3A3FVY9_9BURK|nr:MarR family transcriptional regulator [Noviherbaspirillum saxi]RJF98311.1 MarR family transcriptional regulator [Noviherbaspirillum saxi]
MTKDRRLAEFDITHAQVAIFMKLLYGKSNAASDLARELATDTGAWTRSFDRLEDKGFIECARSTVDRPMIDVALTEKEHRRPDDSGNR